MPNPLSATRQHESREIRASDRRGRRLHLTKYNQLFGVLSHNGIRHLFDMNVMGVINATLGCRDSMRNRCGGLVLNISSMAGYLSATPYMRCRN